MSDLWDATFGSSKEHEHERRVRLIAMLTDSAAKLEAAGFHEAAREIADKIRAETKRLPG